MKTKIVIVDNDESILTMLENHLIQAGFHMLTAGDGKTGLEIIEAEAPDFIILDVVLPDMDGFEVCKLLRQKQIFTPILILSAKNEEFDKVFGLELGADDYMTKPFSPREVVAKVKAILRRADQLESRFLDKEAIERKVSIGNIDVFPNKYESYLSGELVELTPKEFELLVYFISHKGEILTRDQLLEAIWRFESAKDTRVVDVHISHLREKIEKNTRKPSYIKTVRGIGYKMEELV